MLKVANVVPVVALAELKAHLRIEDEHEDAMLSGWLRAATEVIERELGQLLIARGVTEEVAMTASGLRLARQPVVRIDSVAVGVGDDWVELAPDGYAAVVAGDGSVRLSVSADMAATRVRVSYLAGEAGSSNELPEFVRQSVIRIAAHWHANRDSADALAIPASVRRMLATVNAPRLRAIGAAR